MLPMTCYDGYHIFPQSNLDSMGERIVRATGRGAVASWSPTGLGVATAHDFLDQGFLDALFKDGLRRVGEATTAGKLNLWAAAGNHDLLDTYILFGDPALRVNALDADLEAAKTVEPTGDPRPGDMVTYTLTFTNTGPASAFHVVLTDVIPALLIDPVVVYASPEVLEPIAGITFAWTISDLLPGDSGSIRSAPPSTLPPRRATSSSTRRRSPPRYPSWPRPTTQIRLQAPLTAWAPISRCSRLSRRPVVSGRAIS